MAIFGADGSKSKIWRISEGTCMIGTAQAYAIDIQVTVTRQLNPVATIGFGIQWAAQPAQGNATFGTILTKKPELIEALGADKESCTPVPITINGDTKSCEAQSSIRIDDAYCSQVAFSASGQQGYIGQNLAVMFTSCTVTAAG